MKNVTRRALGLGMAAVMLAGGAAVPASAAEADTYVPSAEIYHLDGLAKPTIVKTKKGSAAVKLTWKKVDKASGYKVFMKTKDGWKCKAVVKGGGKLSAKVQGLNAKTRYTFKVQAYKKSKGKTSYSKYSSPVTIETAYGLGTSNWANPYVSVKFNKDAWFSFGDKEVLSLVKKINDDEKYEIFLQATPITDGDKITTDLIVDSVIDEFKAYGYEFTREPNVEINGVKFAKVSGLVDYGTEDNYLAVNYYIKATGKKYFIFYEQYNQNNNTYKKEIDKVWKTVSIK